MGRPDVTFAAEPLSAGFFDDAKKLIARFPEGSSRAALLPLLYLVQSEHGFVSSQGITEVARLLGLTRAEVAGVASFYTMFKRTPQGTWLVSVCTQPSCAFAGATEIVSRLEELLGVSCGDTTADGAVSIEEVECLCVCDGAPVVSVNHETYERMSVDAVVGLVESLRNGATPPPGARGDVPGDFKTVSRRFSGIEAPR
jgi:NADH-quinone oxidoreductase subunit E